MDAGASVVDSTGARNGSGTECSGWDKGGVLDNCDGAECSGVVASQSGATKRGGGVGQRTAASWNPNEERRRSPSS